MREVAVALKVDLNTVRHAYDELERLGQVDRPVGRPDGDRHLERAGMQIVGDRRVDLQLLAVTKQPIIVRFDQRAVRAEVHDVPLMKRLVAQDQLARRRPS